MSCHQTFLGNGQRNLPPVPGQAPGEIGALSPATALETIVVQRTRRWRSGYAGDRTEIFVNGPQVMIR